jgi:hypothetical protein
VHAYNASTQEDHEFQANLGYVARLCLKTMTNKTELCCIIAHTLFEAIKTED